MVGINHFDISGRTVVVVGGTSGLGRAIALGLADAGANVVATGRRSGSELAEEIRALNLAAQTS